MVGFATSLLSMGAVFGLFAAFYYWIGFFTGTFYHEFLGKLHFWVTFLGANLTFLPMHWLGLSGMPRRIPDYPDVYWAWNFICSIGSFISALGLFVFGYLILKIFLNKTKIYLIFEKYLLHDDEMSFKAYNFFHNKQRSLFVIYLTNNLHYIVSKFNYNNVSFVLLLNHVTYMYFIIFNSFKNYKLLNSLLFYIYNEK